MYCHQCGSFNPDDSNFCEKCGASLKKVPTSFVPAPAEGNPPSQKGGKRKIHPLVWILVAVIVLAGIITGIYFALSSQTKDTFQEQLSLGEKYLQELRYEDAVVALNRAIEIDPKNEKSYRLLAQVHVAQEDYDSAVKTLEQGLEATGGNAEIAAMLEGLTGSNSLPQEEPEAATPSPSPTATPIPTDVANASLERVDHSVTNEAGQVLVEHYYDKLVLEETCPEFAAINQLAQEQCDDFFTSANIDQPPLDMVDPEYPFMNLLEGEITCNEKGILSVRLQSKWYMGGVFNSNYVGVNFNLKTGEELKLTDVFAMDEEEVLTYLQEQSVQYIQEHPDQGWWADEIQDAKQIVSEYTLDRYAFYIENNTVYLCYPTYELGPGAMGPVVIPCPIQ